MSLLTDTYPEIQCVYMIKNIENGLTYIGSTMNLCQRMAQHLSGLLNGTHSIILLEDDFYELGIEGFEVSILEQYEPKIKLKELRKREINFINEYPSIYNIYGNNSCNHKMRAAKLESIIYSYRHGIRKSVKEDDKLYDGRCQKLHTRK